MTVQLTIRPFQSTDTEALLALWSQALHLDGITRNLFERKVLLDLNFDPSGLLVADTGNELAGFVYGLVRKVPLTGVGLQEDRGWITAFGVAPSLQRKGIGRALLEKAYEFFRMHHRKLIFIATYAPNYFVPGVDLSAYAGGVSFLQSLGFEKTAEALSMDAPIARFQPGENFAAKEQALKEKGIIIRSYRREDLLPYLDFQKKYMPGDWFELAVKNLTDLTLGRFEEDQIFLALKGDEIVGFCQYENEHLGPFGVRDDYQGLGIGNILLTRTLLQMRYRGCHSAWVLWTSDRAAQGVYGRLGFTITRRFGIFRKELST